MTTYTEEKSNLLARLQNKPKKYTLAEIPEAFYIPEKFACYNVLNAQRNLLDYANADNPFFMTHDSSAAATTSINGINYINFASYNYLGLCGHLDVSNAAKAAIDQYGTSVSASRIVAGERSIQRKLEKAIADLYDLDDAVVFVSGHATNVTTIGHLFGKKDLILYDSLSHNSITQGIILSGAKSFAFPHNNAVALESFLKKYREDYEKVLIVTEGLFSMDGDTPPLKTIIELKKQHKCLLMIDEAHSMGTMGATGKGISEALKINPRDVDIWMGTLSKTFSGCGGFIAGNSKLVDYLRYTAPGFLYSVGIAPPLAAASHEAIQLMLKEPDRVKQLKKNSQLFLELAKNKDLNVGLSEGIAIVPILIGRSLKTIQIANALLKEKIHVQPIIYPAVSETSARLRFFISALHDETQIHQTVDRLAEILSAHKINLD